MLYNYRVFLYPQLSTSEWRETMKKSVKNLSALLALLMMSSAFAVTASAADSTFIKVKSDSAKTETVIDEAEEAASAGNILKTTGWVKTDAPILSDDSSYVTKAKNVVIKAPAAPVTKKIYKNEKPVTIKGGKYYSKKDAEKELKNFFDSHTYDIVLYEDDERIFCDGAYFVSTDNKVVYYDYTTGRLVANDSGTASVYVYTNGGVPFFRLNVQVVNKPGKNPTVVDLIADEWHLDGAGDTTTFTIKSDKYKAEDFKFYIAHGKDIASITKSGKLKVTGKGPIVVRAMHKDYPDVCGETIIYAGDYMSAFQEGYYTYKDNKYTTHYWGYDIGDFRDCTINGWIKSAEGIFIPVLKKFEGTVIREDGYKKETTIVTSTNVTVADLIREAYGDKKDMYTIIDKYNLFKGKDYKKVQVTGDDFDYIKFILSQAYDWCD